MRAPDCFFQLGYLHFAEADYQEALTLSPWDEGANQRMGLLQEKMGFCEHRSKCAGVGGGATGAEPCAGGGATCRGRGPGQEAAWWEPWAKKLSQLCPQNTGFHFHVFTKNLSLFSGHSGNCAFYRKPKCPMIYNSEQGSSLYLSLPPNASPAQEFGKDSSRLFPLHVLAVIIIWQKCFHAKLCSLTSHGIDMGLYLILWLLLAWRSILWRSHGGLIAF